STEARRPAATCHKEHEGCSGGPSRASTHEGRTMGKYSEVFVGIDTAKRKHAVAIADAGRDGETRYLGEIDSAPATVERVIKKLASKYEKVRVCYEAGPTGYGLYRQIITLGHECTVVAPSLIPKKARRSGISSGRGTQRPRTFAKSVSSFFHFCCVMAESIAGASIGPRPMHAGSPHRRSSIRRNRSSFKTPSTRLRIALAGYTASRSSYMPLYRTVRWRQ